MFTVPECTCSAIITFAVTPQNITLFTLANSHKYLLVQICILEVHLLFLAHINSLVPHPRRFIGLQLHNFPEHGHRYSFCLWIHLSQVQQSVSSCFAYTLSVSHASEKFSKCYFIAKYVMADAFTLTLIKTHLKLYSNEIKLKINVEIMINLSNACCFQYLHI